VSDLCMIGLSKSKGKGCYILRRLHFSAFALSVLLCTPAVNNSATCSLAKSGMQEFEAGF